MEGMETLHIERTSLITTIRIKFGTSENGPEDECVQKVRHGVSDKIEKDIQQVIGERNASSTQNLPSQTSWGKAVFGTLESNFRKLNHVVGNGDLMVI